MLAVGMKAPEREVQGVVRPLDIKLSQALAAGFFFMKAFSRQVSNEAFGPDAAADVTLCHV